MARNGVVTSVNKKPLITINRSDKTVLISGVFMLKTPLKLSGKFLDDLALNLL